MSKKSIDVVCKVGRASYIGDMYTGQDLRDHSAVIISIPFPERLLHRVVEDIKSKGVHIKVSYLGESVEEVEEKELTIPSIPKSARETGESLRITDNQGWDWNAWAIPTETGDAAIIVYKCDYSRHLLINGGCIHNTGMMNDGKYTPPVGVPVSIPSVSKEVYEVAMPVKVGGYVGRCVTTNDRSLVIIVPAMGVLIGDPAEGFDGMVIQPR